MSIAYKGRQKNDLAKIMRQMARWRIKMKMIGEKRENKVWGKKKYEKEML